MQRITHATAVNALPTPISTGTPGYFSGGNPGTGQPATVLTVDWANGIQEEIVNVINAAGLSPNIAANNQLLTAMQRLNRIRCTGPLNLYVNGATGNDANTGLSTLTPFATIQRAVDVLFTNYDLSGFSPTINVADGTYTQQVSFVGMPAGATSNTVVNLKGNSSNPAACIISPSGQPWCIFIALSANVRVDGFKLQNGNPANTTFSGGAYGVGAYYGAQASIRNMNFGFHSDGMLMAQYGSGIVIESTSANSVPFTISGSAKFFASASFGGQVSFVGGAVTITGGPNFSLGFAYGGITGVVSIYFTSFSGTATGPVARVDPLGAVVINGNSTTSYLPGNSAATNNSSIGYFG